VVSSSPNTQLYIFFSALSIQVAKELSGEVSEDIVLLVFFLAKDIYY